jgi:Putative peptidoglycan binding domain
MTLPGDEPELQLGDNGDHVLQLQQRLSDLGLLDSRPDGSFDDATEGAVRRLHLDLGLGDDGRVTAATWQALDQHWGVVAVAPVEAGHADQLVFDPLLHQTSPDGRYWWDGVQWNEHTEWAAASWPEPGPATAEPIPHLDDVHPAIRADARFATFHDFLREQGTPRTG